MTAAILAAVALAAGYALRCWQPCKRASDWAWSTTWGRDTLTRRQPAWWARQTVLAVELAVGTIHHPIRVARAWRAWRNRKPPAARRP